MPSSKPEQPEQIVSKNLFETSGTRDKLVLGSPSSEDPINLATISAGFEKGDFLVREVKNQRVYFDFFEEAFNYISCKGYARMEKQQEEEWFNIMQQVHSSIKMRYNTGKLLMVLARPAEINLLKNTTKTNEDKKSINP